LIYNYRVHESPWAKEAKVLDESPYYRQHVFINKLNTMPKKVAKKVAKKAPAKKPAKKAPAKKSAAKKKGKK